MLLLPKPFSVKAQSVFSRRGAENAEKDHFFFSFAIRRLFRKKSKACLTVFGRVWARFPGSKADEWDEWDK
jgi:hypothetical protein